jgi:hypothetical protein
MFEIAGAAGVSVVEMRQNTTLPGGFDELVGSGKLEAECPFVGLICAAVGKSSSTGVAAAFTYAIALMRFPGPALITTGATEETGLPLVVK